MRHGASHADGSPDVIDLYDRSPRSSWPEALGGRASPARAARPQLAQAGLDPGRERRGHGDAEGIK